MVRMVAIFSAIAVFTATANLLLKLGVTRPGLGEGWPFNNINAFTTLGVLSFAAGLLCYMGALRVLPLHAAQSLAAVQFIAVILASRYVLGEPITSAKWIGIVLIASGIGLIGSEVGSGHLGR
jgi:drug/metabolite transporter (DMT)-like permease